MMNQPLNITKITFVLLWEWEHVSLVGAEDVSACTKQNNWLKIIFTI